MILFKGPGCRIFVIHIWERVLIRAHAHLTISIHHKYRMQHVAFGYPTAATVHANRAVRHALTAWTEISPVWHV
eukprot:8610474-Pyramimonas_sp.AAC.1